MRCQSSNRADGGPSRRSGPVRSSRWPNKPYRKTGQHRRRFRPPTPDGRKSSANRWEADPGSGAAPCSPGGHGALGQDKEPAVVSHQAQATVALSTAPSDPLVAMLEVLGWSAEDQQSKPLTLGIGSHVVEAFTHRFEAPQIVMLIEQSFETFQFGALYKPHLNLV